MEHVYSEHVDQKRRLARREYMEPVTPLTVMIVGLPDLFVMIIPARNNPGSLVPATVSAQSLVLEEPVFKTNQHLVELAM